MSETPDVGVGEPGDAQAPRRRRRQKRGADGRLYTYVKATPRRRGYLDTRLRRRWGPKCVECGRKHFKHQKCWAGPNSAKRDLKKLREERLLQKQLERARLEAAQNVAHVNARGPETIGVPKREGARYIGGGNVVNVRPKR